MQFNHAMIYSRDVARALAFYRDLLGFQVLQEFQVPGTDHVVYARLQSPGSETTIALHALEKGQKLHPGGIRLYFEVRNLDRFCSKLAHRGAKFTKLPEMMPWGWKHAYLDDPDGHEVSLYWAGAKRLKRTK
jgi:catechol 2,3-dioxygenase-like lactoylglutathione lyase family enzyme